MAPATNDGGRCGGKALTRVEASENAAGEAVSVPAMDWKQGVRCPAMDWKQGGVSVPATAWTQGRSVGADDGLEAAGLGARREGVEWKQGRGILVARTARVWGRRKGFYSDGMTVNIKRVLGYN